MMGSHISFLHWNVAGIASKLQDLDFIEYISSFDVVSLVETFVDSFQSTIFENNFAIFTKPALKFTRQGRHSGGIICLVRKSLLPYFKKLECSCHNHILFVFDKKLFGINKDVLFVCAYVHPESSPFYVAYDVDDGISYLEDCLTEKLLSNDVEILLCGDLNARVAKIIPENIDIESMHHYCNNTFIDTLSRYSEDTVLNNYGKKFLYMCTSLGLCMLNGVCNGDLEGRYTYISDTGNSVNYYFVASL
jgi:exonuclease III